jgi:toxin YoeB
MKKIFSDDAWDDYIWWQNQPNKQIIKRVNTLIHDIDRHGYEGIGKPEPLRFEWSGWWSRRITDEHRIIYRISEDNILIASLRYHYSK